MSAASRIFSRLLNEPTERAIHAATVTGALLVQMKEPPVPLRDEALARWPEIRTALQSLAGRITADDMRAMNEAVDGQHRDAAEVVRQLRANKGL